jgi:hypothetical protein
MAGCKLSRADILMLCSAALVTALCAANLYDSWAGRDASSFKKSNQSLWTSRVNKRGIVEIMDVDSARYLDTVNSSMLPAPSQDMLDKLLESTSQVSIVDSGTSGGRLLGDRVIFKSSDPQVIAQLKDFMKINSDPRSFGHDYCLGGPTLELNSRQGQKTLICIHHGYAIRWDAWKSDACLLHPGEFIDWLANKGANGPKREQEQMLEQAKYSSRELQQKRLDQFVATMPEPLRIYIGPLHVGVMPGGGVGFMLSEMSDKLKGHYDTRGAKAALASRVPNETQQISAILEWSGSITDAGAGAYLMFPTELLLEYEPDRVTSFVKSEQLSTNQWIGAGRFYSYFGFRDRFPCGYPPLDAQLKQRITKELFAAGRNQRDAYEFQGAIKEWMPPTRLEAIRRQTLERTD